MQFLIDKMKKLKVRSDEVTETLQQLIYEAMSILQEQFT